MSEAKDWAYEVANDLFMGITRREIEENGQPFVERIAAALRKAQQDKVEEMARSLNSFADVSDAMGNPGGQSLRNAAKAMLIVP